MKYSKFKNSNESPGLLFWQVSSQWKRKIKEALIPFDLTHTQFVILAVSHTLNYTQGTVTQKDISDSSKVDVMTISKSIRLLEKKELVIRLNDLNDTRAKTITVTEKGETLLRTVAPIIENVDEQFFSLNQKEIDTFLDLLNKLKENQ